MVPPTTLREALRLGGSDKSPGGTVRRDGAGVSLSLAVLRAMGWTRLDVDVKKMRRSPSALVADVDVDDGSAKKEERRVARASAA